MAKQYDLNALNIIYQVQGSPDLSDYSSEFKEITANVTIDVGDRVKSVAKLECILVSSGRYGFRDILDLTDRSAIFMPLFKEGDEVRDVVQNKTGCHDTCAKLLIVHRLEVLPKYRGLGITERILNDADNLFVNDFGLIALQPYPLQFSKNLPSRFTEKMKFEKLNQDETQATKQLVNFYQKIGFSKVGGLMVRQGGHLWPYQINKD